MAKKGTKSTGPDRWNMEEYAASLLGVQKRIKPIDPVAIEQMTIANIISNMLASLRSYASTDLASEQGLVEREHNLRRMFDRMVTAFCEQLKTRIRSKP